jgi:hypothetical protein
MKLRLGINTVGAESQKHVIATDFDRLAMGRIVICTTHVLITRARYRTISHEMFNLNHAFNTGKCYIIKVERVLSPTTLQRVSARGWDSRLALTN